ncbi:hypothetical protein RvY_07509 [Ramazzottius varieornatus]|uniref:BLOC-1-related complex subunit 8 homolog n=1 Tax=Ramazzottius varieornatus TaxID=947166 RepID=A0A1D1V2F9_RAMVA|nr:hypothetical protein RvY_07509 [Ramazzottius varieornatus]
MQAGGEFDPNFDRKVRKVAEKLSDNVHGILNEPSLGMYRIHEHVRKSMPVLVQKKMETSQQIQQLQGACYDMEQTLNGARCVMNSKKHFAAVHDLLKNSIFLAQHIQYERTRSLNVDLQTRRDRHTQGRTGVPSSISVDIPDESRRSSSLSRIKQSRTTNSLRTDAMP